MQRSFGFHHRLVVRLIFLNGMLSATTLFADEISPPRFATPLLTAAGRVVDADGSPAKDIFVHYRPTVEEPEQSTATNGEGEFQIRGVFGNGCLLHFTSTDHRRQATLTVPPVMTRTVLAKPLQVKLQPAAPRQVKVVAQGKPADGVKVVAKGTSFSSHGITGPDGTVELLLPAGGRIHQLTAWHLQLGVTGRVDYPDGLAEEPIALTLHPLGKPSSHTIRLVDQSGRAIPGIELKIALGLVEPNDWIPLSNFPEGRLKTDATGQVVVPWMPGARLSYVTAELESPDWKIDEEDNAQIKQGITTIHARQMTTILGRITMPAGKSAEGLLVSADGFGPKRAGFVSHTRPRPDGWFTIRMPADHGLSVGLLDLDWACDPWIGKVLDAEGHTLERMTLRAHPATPVTVRATRGPNHHPVIDGWVHFTSLGPISFVDQTGETHDCLGGVRAWFKTNEHGEIRTGVARGEHQFRLTSGKWAESKRIQVINEKPLVVEFEQR